MHFGQIASMTFASILVTFVTTAPHAEQIVKVGLVDPMSGAFAASGRLGEQHFRYGIDHANNGVLAGTGFRLELAIYDNEVSPEKSLVMLRKAIDDGVHYVTQGNGSSVAYALTDAVAKNNKRDPERAVLYLNYAAVDPSLTNAKCNWWHFRFDADSDMKMHALTDYLVAQKDVHKVYVFNQDYSFGQAVEQGALAMLKDRRSDLQVVAAERVPLGKVKDFAPYVAKMQAAGADAVVTGNWGVDLSLLVKAANDSGFKGRFFTYYLGSRDIVSQIGPAGKGAAVISTYYNNVDSPDMERLADGFEKKYDQTFSSWTAVNEMEMLGAAIKKAGSADPLKVGKALGGMQWKNPMGTVTMRADNHQLLQPMFVSVLDTGVKHVYPDVNMGFREIGRIEPDKTEMATTCKFPDVPR